MFGLWYCYTFEDGYTTISKQLSYKQYSILTHTHGKILKKERYKGQQVLTFFIT